MNELLICKININWLTLQPLNYLIAIFTHLKLCLADAIHNFKWVKVIQISQNGVYYFKLCWLMSGFIGTMFKRWYLMC